MMKEKLITAVVALIALCMVLSLGAMMIESPVVAVILAGMVTLVGLIIAGAQYAK